MHLFRVILPVTSIESAARFYAQVFGTPGERVSTGRHYFAPSGPRGAVLACYSPEEDGDAVRHGDQWQPHPLQYLYFSVADLSAARERCLAAGAAEVSSTKTMPWGETMFYALDPFGNPISFVQEGTEFTGKQLDP